MDKDSLSPEEVEAEEEKKDIEAVQAALAEGGDPIPLEQLKRELGL